MDPQFVIDYLNRLTDGSEAARVTNYTVWIGGREVAVQVYDRGERAGDTRYSVLAEWARPDEEGTNPTRRTLSNAAPILVEALGGVHWWNFEPKD